MPRIIDGVLESGRRTRARALGGPGIGEGVGRPLEAHRELTRRPADGPVYGALEGLGDQGRLVRVGCDAADGEVVEGSVGCVVEEADEAARQLALGLVGAQRRLAVQRGVDVGLALVVEDADAEAIGAAALHLDLRGGQVPAPRQRHDPQTLVA